VVSNPFVLACQEIGLNVHVISERFPFDPAVPFAMRKLIATQSPDIVQTHAVKSHFLMRLTGMRRQFPWIAFHHGYTWPNAKVRVYNQLDRFSLPSASRVVTVCHPFAIALQAIGVNADRIAIRHNSVDTFLAASEAQVQEMREALGIPAGAQVLLNVGRLSREKGQADLIKAVSILRKTNDSRALRLVMVGDGPDRQKLGDVAKQLGVSDWVTFAGHRANVTPFYTMANLVVLSSHTEGSPNTLLEAMAAGLPIVATAVGGVPEIVSHNKEALLVRKNNPVDLANSIERVLSDASLQKLLSGQGRSTAATYSPAVYCDSMLDLYHRCLAEELK